MEEKKVPALRFRGFDNAWEQRRLGELADKVTEKNTLLAKTEVLTNSAEFGIINQREFFDHDIVNENNIGGYYIVRERDFVYNPRISVSAPVGPINCNKLGKSGVMSPLYTVFRVHDIDSVYLEYFFKTSRWHSFMRFNGDSGVRSDRFSIKTELFYKMPIPITKYCEQVKIGKYFSQLDHLISLHQRKLEMLKKIKKSMLEKMFPKNDAKVPELRFSDFTDAWEQCKFSDVVEIGSGMDYKHLGIGDIPVYGTGGYMLSVDVALSENNDAIGIGRKGTIDKPYILRAPFWTVDTLFYCIPKYNHNLDFTNCLFQNIDWKNKDESTGVPSLSKVIINSIETSIPSYEEQKKIGEYFKSFENLIILHQRKLEKLKNIKKSMLEKMFII